MESMHHKDNHTLIADLVKDLPKRDLPIVYHNAPLKDVVRAMVETVHSRLLYVVDDEGKLLGSISLGSLMRHVFVEFHEPRVHSRSMIDSLVNETAEHLMRPRPHCAAQDDAVAADGVWVGLIQLVLMGDASTFGLLLQDGP